MKVLSVLKNQTSNIFHSIHEKFRMCDCGINAVNVSGKRMVTPPFLHHRWTVMVSPLKMRSCLIWVLLYFQSKFHRNPNHCHDLNMLNTLEQCNVFIVVVCGSVALMNHSCSPNVIVTYKGTVAEVRAVQDISPEEEVRRVTPWTRVILRNLTAYFNVHAYKVTQILCSI